MHSQEDSQSLGQKINQIVVHSSDTETMLQQISQTLAESFGVDGCLTTVIDEDGQPHQIGYWYKEEFVTVLQQWQSRELIALLPNQSELIAIERLQTTETEYLTPSQNKPLPFQSVLSIPICFQGKQNGLITLWRLHPYQWSDYEQERVQKAAESLPIVLEQISQANSIASLKQFVHTSTQYQNAVNQLTMASRNTLDLDQILQLAISGTSQSLQVERGLIITLKYSDLLFKNRPKHIIPKAKITVISECKNNFGSPTPINIINFSDQLCDDSSTLNKTFWLSECFLCQQALINAPEPFISNFNNDIEINKHQSKINPVLNIINLPSVLMFPLENQGTVFGFLLMQNSYSRTWKPEELALLELVSVQVSTAIIQNQTLRQVQNLVEERTAQLQRSLEVQSKLYEKTRQQIDQLRQMNKIKDEFIDTISHELRTPLTSMNLAIRMLRTPGISVERKSKYLDILEQQCTQEINLVTDLLRLQKLESNQTPLNLQIIKISSKLNDLVQIHTETWSQRGLNITVTLPERPLSLQTDADSFDRILHELLTNAGKYADSDTNVSVRAIQQGDRIIISVTNIGAAIAPENATDIFDKFRRGHGVTDKAIKGTGLGLALVKSLVQHLNGTIEVASTPIEQSSSAWVCFTLTLPQLPVPN
ncbi:GAF domain-containing sensor histidine kinase [Synechocystis sp. PCC 7509]|uniref:GAF domain-containing sensor histidine kinase n=1 Tax=Synechocystis sp. PCC 7509 TaxID=927677 RepID=UPI00130E8437|nr:GAF domain-containing sensor histidine kinase [Synechocystis sp. PCC 7509]